MTAAVAAKGLGRSMRAAALALVAVFALDRPALADRPDLVAPVAARIAIAIGEAEDLARCLARLPAGRASALPILVEAWEERRGLWIGTLWATGFGETEVAALTLLLDGAKLPPGGPPRAGCADAVARLEGYLNRRPAIDASVIAGAGISWGEIAIDRPDSAEKIRAAIAPRMRRWQELLACRLALADAAPDWATRAGVSETAFGLELHALRMLLKARGWPAPKARRFMAQTVLEGRWLRPTVTAPACLAVEPGDLARWGGADAGAALKILAARALGVAP